MHDISRGNRTHGGEMQLQSSLTKVDERFGRVSGSIETPEPSRHSWE
jgi:hypothetical protein